MIQRRSTLYLRQGQKHLQLFLHRDTSSPGHISLLVQEEKNCCFHTRATTSVNRVISLPHTRCILHSLCLPVPNFSQLSVNLASFLRISENIFQIDLVTVFDAILTSRQTREKLQCLYENLMSNNFRRTAVLKKYDL